MRNIQAEIQEELDRIEKTRDVEIIHAIESGSRAWGFASPDSDYDVRFVYAHKRDWYLSVFAKKDVIERPCDEVLDISGWDLKKACGLLKKSNGALLEWIQSPIVYRQVPEKYELLKELANCCFRVAPLFFHYRAMFKSSFLKIQETDKAKLKTYLYALRPAFCCDWLLKKRTMPPVEFFKLAEFIFQANENGEFEQELNVLLHRKGDAKEAETMPRSPVLDATLEKMLDHFENNPPLVDKGPDNQDIEQLFRKFF